MKLFAIFGNPVAHSKSPLMHNKVFEDLGIDACYVRYCLKDGAQLREKFLSLGLSGINVTIPHKEAAYEACDEVVGFAKEVKVVNTIVKRDDKLIGYNTDADGFMFAISEFKGIKKVLVLGAGGTAKALVMRFLQEGLDVEVLNRSAARLPFFTNLGALTHTWESFTPKPFDLVLNTTSAGLDDDALPAPKELLIPVLERSRYAADAIYGKLTPFLQAAKKLDIPYKDGSDMLLGQGVLANELFLQGKFAKEDIYNSMKEIFSY